LPISRGIAGFVARTGQAMIVEQVGGDPRFARDVAERVGYVPESIVAAPIVDDRGEVSGVLSILDRSRESSDTLAIASASAEHAALVLSRAALGIDLSTMVLRTIAAAVENDDGPDNRDLAAALRRVASRSAGDAVLRDEMAALLVELRGLTPEGRASATRILGELTRFASTSRRRR
jgi:transcriptional regulator of acetoin/glycerol metabolism